MNLKILAATVILTPAWLGTLPAKGANPEHLQQLLNTRICQKCDLSGADLSGVNLTGVDLSGANLTNANLSGTNLNGANLSDADLTNAKLTDTDLQNANLTNTTGLSATNLATPNQPKPNPNSSQQVNLPVQGGSGHFTPPDRIPAQTRGAGGSR